MTLNDLPPDPKGGHITRKYGARIRELHGISPAMIADELGIKERTVCMVQRKLGLRACRQYGSENT